ncbi:uncharacterized protein BDW70DRAFT_18725 [Aspergillus foveolatus]|uniref:uncharacterized protein n=1 Tax=Aspergillus foveolatus TaxID=210207 RepID=UPI003CCE5196
MNHDVMNKYGKNRAAILWNLHMMTAMMMTMILYHILVYSVRFSPCVNLSVSAHVLNWEALIFDPVLSARMPS